VRSSGSVVACGEQRPPDAPTPLDLANHARRSAAVVVATVAWYSADTAGMSAAVASRTITR